MLAIWHDYLVEVSTVYNIRAKDEYSVRSGKEKYLNNFKITDTFWYSHDYIIIPN